MFKADVPIINDLTDLLTFYNVCGTVTENLSINF